MGSPFEPAVGVAPVALGNGANGVAKGFEPTGTRTAIAGRSKASVAGS